jgi:hypothetical protein
LIEEGNSISNQPWRISDRNAMRDVLETNRVYVHWTEEDGRLLADWLNIGKRQKLLAKQWEDRTAGQMKNIEDSVLRHRVQGHQSDHQTCAHILDQDCRRLPIPQLSLAQSEVTQKLKRKGIMPRKLETLSPSRKRSTLRTDEWFSMSDGRKGRESTSGSFDFLVSVYALITG